MVVHPVIVTLELGQVFQPVVVHPKGALLDEERLLGLAVDRPIIAKDKQMLELEPELVHLVAEKELELGVVHLGAGKELKQVLKLGVDRLRAV